MSITIPLRNVACRQYYIEAHFDGAAISLGSKLPRPSDTPMTLTVDTGSSDLWVPTSECLGGVGEEDRCPPPVPGGPGRMLLRLSENDDHSQSTAPGKVIRYADGTVVRGVKRQANWISIRGAQPSLTEGAVAAAVNYTAVFDYRAPKGLQHVADGIWGLAKSTRNERNNVINGLIERYGLSGRVTFKFDLKEDYWLVTYLRGARRMGKPRSWLILHSEDDTVAVAATKGKRRIQLNTESPILRESPLRETHWLAPITSINLLEGDDAAYLGGGGGIVGLLDTGSTRISLNEELYDRFAARLERQSNHTCYRPPGKNSKIECDCLSPNLSHFGLDFGFETAGWVDGSSSRGVEAASLSVSVNKLLVSDIRRRRADGRQYCELAVDRRRLGREAGGISLVLGLPFFREVETTLSFREGSVWLYGRSWRGSALSGGAGAANARQMGSAMLRTQLAAAGPVVASHLDYISTGISFLVRVVSAALMIGVLIFGALALFGYNGSCFVTVADTGGEGGSVGVDGKKHRWEGETSFGKPKDEAEVPLMSKAAKSGGVGAVSSVPASGREGKSFYRRLHFQRWLWPSSYVRTLADADEVTARPQRGGERGAAGISVLSREATAAAAVEFSNPYDEDIFTTVEESAAANSAAKKGSAPGSPVGGTSSLLTADTTNALRPSDAYLAYNTPPTSAAFSVADPTSVLTLTHSVPPSYAQPAYDDSDADCSVGPPGPSFKRRDFGEEGSFSFDADNLPVD